MLPCTLPAVCEVVRPVHTDLAAGHPDATLAGNKRDLTNSWSPFTLGPRCGQCRAWDANGKLSAPIPALEHSARGASSQDRLHCQGFQILA